MRFSTSVLATVAASLVAAAPADPGTPGVLRVPVTHRSSGQHRLMRRSAVLEPLQNQVYQYVAQLSIGTPAQTVECLLDTGSSDLWVYSNKAGVDPCYTPSSSASYRFLEEGFEIQYVSGTAKGDWITDNVALEGTTVENLQFATVDDVTTSGPDPIGIFGIGFASGESVSSGQTYPNFPQMLANEGIIASNAYSLFLDDLEASSGSILFGGIDTAKYEGDLVTLPIVQSDALAVTASVEGTSFTAVLDSGTSLSYIPKQVADGIAEKYGGVFDNTQGLYFVDNIPNGNVSFSFGSGGQVVVPGSELAVEATLFGVPNPIKKYAFTIVGNDQSSGYNLLGDSFLRSAYVVYDLTNKQISIAQAKYTDESNVQPITSSGTPTAQKRALGWFYNFV
ncbi:aspartic proteinase yapsin-3 [Trichomonascus vanleenenianus]|uniref:pepsin-like aspartic protease n=1 Tax=Trichomonascus vanleenenianus TaxID=2268995 RepID=UPI003EC96ECD